MAAPRLHRQGRLLKSGRVGWAQPQALQRMSKHLCNVKAKGRRQPVPSDRRIRPSRARETWERDHDPVSPTISSVASSRACNAAPTEMFARIDKKKAADSGLAALAAGLKGPKPFLIARAIAQYPRLFCHTWTELRRGILGVTFVTDLSSRKCLETRVSLRAPSSPQCQPRSPRVTRYGYSNIWSGQ